MRPPDRSPAESDAREADVAARKIGTSFDLSGEALLDVQRMNFTPLPAALPLFMGALGLIAMIGARKRRKAKAA